MLEKLQKIYNRVSGTTGFALTRHTRLKDLELTSLGLIQLICAVEDEFDLEISNATFRKFKTVAHIISYLEKNVK